MVRPSYLMYSEFFLALHGSARLGTTRHGSARLSTARDGRVSRVPCGRVARAGASPVSACYFLPSGHRMPLLPPVTMFLTLISAGLTRLLWALGEPFDLPL